MLDKSSGSQPIDASLVPDKPEWHRLVEQNNTSLFDNLFFLSACLTLGLIFYTGWAQATYICDELKQAAKNIVNQILD